MIGITERGDASIHTEWIDKMYNMDAGIIISKGLSPALQKGLLKHINKVIFHATTTGYGGTVVEPNSPRYVDRINSLYDFIKSGFPAKQIVLRVDPIICTEKGLQLASDVIRLGYEIGIRRFRYSYLDLYSHVNDRFLAAGLPIPKQDFKMAIHTLSSLHEEYGASSFESCAEIMSLSLHQCGCISSRDLNVLNLDIELTGNKGQRSACICPAQKIELLDNHQGKCQFKCIYCYWKDVNR